MLRNVFFVIILSALLRASGPVFKTQYTYQPPSSSMGKVCMTQCVQNQSMCEQMCQLRNQTCRLQAHQDALYQYETYKQEQERKGLTVTRNVSDFEYSHICSEQCGCTSTFNTCYSACGGKVTEHKVCVAFCDSGKNK